MADTNPTGTNPAVEIDEEETEAYIAGKRARDAAVDDGDGAHGGGMGASGSAVDFGQPKNYTTDV